MIGEVSDGRSATKLAKELDPDVVLMDIAMAGMNGLEATRRIRQESPRTKILMLSMYTNEEYSKRRFAQAPPVICSKTRIAMNWN